MTSWGQTRKESLWFDSDLFVKFQLHWLAVLFFFFCFFVCFANMTQARVIREEGILVEKMPP